MYSLGFGGTVCSCESEEMQPCEHRVQHQKNGKVCWFPFVSDFNLDLLGPRKDYLDRETSEYDQYHSASCVVMFAFFPTRDRSQSDNSEYKVP